MPGELQYREPVMTVLARTFMYQLAQSPRIRVKSIRLMRSKCAWIKIISDAVLTK
jgi:hypothetical protein